ncbi:hypothetical protein Tco_1238854, partial [Tanacetum coccineum]
MLIEKTLGLLALKDIEIKEGLKTKAYEISVLNQKHDELVKKSLLTRSQLEGYLKENTKVISDLKVKEGRDIDKMIEMDKQIKFLNEILYKRNQSIQTIHMLAPKCATYNGRSTFANPKFFKIAQLCENHHEDFEYVESLEKEIDELESEKADFSNIYDLLLEECVSKDVTCSYLHSLSDLMLMLKKEKKCPSEYKWTKTTPSRPSLKWKSTGRIFSNVRLRWIPTGELLNSCTCKVESEPTHGSNVDTPHIHACKQTLGLSAGTSFNGQKQQRIDLNADALYNAKQENLRVWLLKMLISKKPVPEWPHSSMFKMTSVHISSVLVLHQMTSDHNRSELEIHDHINESSSSKLVPKVIPPADKKATSRQELELLFHHHIAMLKTT